jgi:antitoxin component of MazEF toxin-antitoxin module
MLMRRPGSSSVLRRARIRLLPLPGAAVGLAVLVAVLAAALVSAPLFVASAEQGAWQQEQDRISRASLGASVLGTTVGRRGGPPAGRVESVDEYDAAVREAAQSVGLAAPDLLLFLRNEVGATSTTGGDLARVLSLPGAADNVEILAGGDSSDGVLVPEQVADAEGFVPGSTVTLQGEGGGAFVVPVSGVYRTPVAPLADFWDGFGFLFLPTRDQTTGDLVFPPSAVIAPLDLAQSVAGAVGEDVNLDWSVPLDESAGISEARRAADRYEALQAALTNPDGAAAGVVAGSPPCGPPVTSSASPSSPSSSAGRSVACSGGCWSASSARPRSCPPGSPTGRCSHSSWASSRPSSSSPPSPPCS